MAEKIFDAVIIGSGATGGYAAKELCEAGWNVALLEAGRQIGHRYSRPYRSLARQPGYRHKPAGTLNDLIEGRLVHVRALLAIARNAGQDDAGINGP